MTAAWNTYTATSNARRPDEQRSPGPYRSRQRSETGRCAAGGYQCGPGRAGLGLRHKPPAEIDIARMKLWVRQLLVDARAKKTGAVAGDVAALEWIWDRIAHIAGKPSAKRVETQLKALRAAGDDEDLTAASEAVSGLSTVLDGLQSS